MLRFRSLAGMAGISFALLMGSGCDSNEVMAPKVLGHATHDVAPVGDDARFPMVVDPRHENRVIEPERGHNITVAILSSPEFNAVTSIDAGSVRLGPANVPARSENAVDIDHDGDRDMVYHFDLSATGLTCLDRRVTMHATIEGISASASADLHTIAVDIPEYSYIVRCANPRVIVTEIAPSEPSLLAALINDRGQVAGQMLDHGNSVATRWADGVLSKMPAPSGESFLGTMGQNDRGDIVFMTFNPLTFAASSYLWSGSSVTKLPVQGSVEPRFLNRRGDVAGFSYSDGSIWRMVGGRVDYLPATLSRRSISPRGITNNGVLGGSFLDAADRSHVFLWNGKTVTDLTPPGQSAYAWFMNDRAQILGFSTTNDIDYVLTIWSKEGAVVLGGSDLLPAGFSNCGDAFLQTGFGPDSRLYVWRNGAITRVGENEPGGLLLAGFNDACDFIAYSDDSKRYLLFRTDGSRVPLLDGQLNAGFVFAMNNRNEALGKVSRDGQDYTAIWGISR